MAALTTVTGLRCRRGGRGRPVRGTRDSRKPASSHGASANPQVGLADDGCYRSATWTDLNPYGPDLRKQLVLTLANVCPWRIRRSGAHHDVAEAGVEPIAHAGFMTLASSFCIRQCLVLGADRVSGGRLPGCGRAAHNRSIGALSCRWPQIPGDAGLRCHPWSASRGWNGFFTRTPEYSWPAFRSAE
jgi:hypothetical protein